MAVPWNLEELTMRDVADAAYEVAVLPFGATEPHNPHLPYGTDTLEARIAGGAVCAEASRLGARVVLLPTIPYGTERNMHGFPLAININPSTMHLVVRDIVESLTQSGIRKIVLFNVHGGNALKPIVRELQGLGGAHLFLCNWLDVVADRYDSIFDKAEDHAGEAETSFALSAFPGLVGRTADGGLDADAGTTRAFRFEAMNRGWVGTSRAWHLLTASSGSGDPHGATAVKGEQLVALLVERLAPFLVELSESPLDDRFPFIP
jgi:creatinine amidohydrolase